MAARGRLVSELEDGLAPGLLVELHVGLFGVVDAPPVREDLVDIDAVVGHEPDALPQPDAGEGVGPEDRDLLDHDVRGNVEFDVPTETDEYQPAPRPERPGGRNPSGRGPRA